MKPHPILFGLALTACSQSGDDRGANNESILQSNAVGLDDPYARADNVALPDDRTPLEEPDGPIDPTSPEGAGQVVQSFGALIEQEKWVEAEALWSDAGAASRFTSGLKRNRESHIEIGRPGNAEGAGLVRVTVPIIFYGKNGTGTDFRRGADVVLRRATGERRGWHIERIDLQP